MARALWRARPIGFAALIALLGLTGCVYEPPGYGGYDYGGYSDGGGQYYGDGQYYDNGGQYYRHGGGGYYGNGYDNSYGYRGYGHGYRPCRYAQPRYGYPYRNQYRHGGDYCRYHRCDGDDNDD
jgi:hypothetical protein